MLLNLENIKFFSLKYKAINSLGITCDMVIFFVISSLDPSCE